MPIENTDLLDIDQREASIRQRIYEQSHFWADAPEDPDLLPPGADWDSDGCG
jgi:hypothetical protein